MKVEAPFCDKLSGLAIVKLLDYDTHTTMTLKFKFERNFAFLDVSHNSLKEVMLSPSRAIGTVHLRSMDYYKK